MHDGVVDGSGRTSSDIARSSNVPTARKLRLRLLQLLQEIDQLEYDVRLGGEIATFVTLIISIFDQITDVTLATSLLGTEEEIYGHMSFGFLVLANLVSVMVVKVLGMHQRPCIGHRDCRLGHDALADGGAVQVDLLHKRVTTGAAPPALG
eukprot:1032123-Prymnesium_polylepis.4